MSPVRRFTLAGGLFGAVVGYWIAIWCSRVLAARGRRQGDRDLDSLHDVLVRADGAHRRLSTVAGLFISARIPRLTMTVGYDGRFSAGDYGVWVQCAPEKLKDAEEILRRCGAVEVHGAQ